MRTILWITIGLGLAAPLNAQTNFFGNKAPSGKKSLTVNLPDKPNLTDSNGQKQGEWAKKYDNGYYRYVATFVNDRPVGLLVRYSEQGKKTAEIQYADSDKGKARLFDDTERLMAEGNYVRNQRDSIWTFFSPKGEVTSREPYVNGKLHGVSSVYYPNGQIAEETTYADGVKHGSWKAYHLGKVLKSRAQYANGLLEGKFESFTPEGVPDLQGNYKNGKQEGVWNVYDSETKTYFEMKFSQDVLLNSDEINQRMNKKLKQQEKESKRLKDPERYRNDPEGYLR